MANNFFTKTGNPANNSAGSSSLMRAEFAAVEAGFDKMPALTANGTKLVRVNAAETALEAVASTSLGLVAGETHAAATKATPADTDEIPLTDSTAAFALKNLTWANLKAALKTYFDGLVTTLTNKTINLTSNTLTGTIAQFNAACSDADFATGGGTATGTNTGDQTNISGNAATVTNGLYSTGTYSAPAWLTALANTTTINSYSIGYREVPRNNQNGAYSIASGDVGQHIYSANSGAQTITLPAGLAVGMAVTVVNNGTTAITFTTTGNTVYKAGTSAAWASGGTLGVRGLCTFLCVAPNTWFVSGAGLS